MILAWLIVIPLAGGLAAWALERASPALPRVAALAAMMVELALAVLLAVEYAAVVRAAPGAPWALEMSLPWVPALGIAFTLALDGLSLVLVLLTVLLGIMALSSSWTEIRERTGFFHFNLLWVLAGILGVFLAMDLFLFYFFWEMMLIPMFFLILVFGHENRARAGFKFFLFTQLGGLFLLVSILGLYFVHGRATGTFTFDYRVLVHTPMGPGTGTWLMLGFLAAFAVKLPVFPLHTWLPDAHTEAPTAGSVILAGLLLKTGAYGLLRFLFPLFPGAAASFAPAAMALAIVGILYGAVMAFAQTDVKRLVAYTSVSHMGFVLLGVFAWNLLSLSGVVMQMVCHGIATGALFMLAGSLQERLGTRDMGRMGGLFTRAPRLGGAMMLFALASLGLPGLGNFVGEFLVLLGAWKRSALLATLAAGGFILASVYALWMIQAVLHGPAARTAPMADLSAREAAALAVLAAAIVWLGLFPQAFLGTVNRPLASLTENVRVMEPPPAWMRIAGADRPRASEAAPNRIGGRP